MKYSMVELTEDKDIKPLGFINLKFTPTIGITFTNISLEYCKRFRYKVFDVSYHINFIEKIGNSYNIEQVKKVEPLLVVEALFEEDI